MECVIDSRGFQLSFARLNPEDFLSWFGVKFHGVGTYLDSSWCVVIVERDVREKTSTAPKTTLFAKVVASYVYDVQEWHKLAAHPFVEDTGYSREIMADMRCVCDPERLVQYYHSYIESKE